MTEKTTGTKNSPVGPDDADEAPELTDSWFEKADLMEGDRIIRRGRPGGKSEPSKTVRSEP